MIVSFPGGEMLVEFSSGIDGDDVILGTNPKDVVTTETEVPIMVGKVV